MTARAEENKETVRNAIAALNARDLDRFFTYHTEDTTSQEVYFDRPLGRDEFRRFLEGFLYAYPDVRIETQRMIAEGDTVVVENVMSATFVNDLDEVAATGRSFRINEAVVFELADGLIRTARIYLDQKTLAEQQGTDGV